MDCWFGCCRIRSVLDPIQWGFRQAEGLRETVKASVAFFFSKKDKEIFGGRLCATVVCAGYML